MAKMKQKQNFCIIKIQRFCGGIKISAKSKKLEEFFESLHRQSGSSSYTNSTYWADIQGYYVTSFDTPYAKLSKWGLNFLIIDNLPNLSFLRGVGLKNGLVLKINGVFSQDTVDVWIEKTKLALQKFYQDYLKPIEVEFIISTRERRYKA